MKINFNKKSLSREQLSGILGGGGFATCVADCADGTTRICQGSVCYQETGVGCLSDEEEKYCDGGGAALVHSSAS